MVAALAGTDVVVAGGGRIDQATVAGLRATLDGEVTRIAKVAAAGRLGPPGMVVEAGTEPEAEIEVEPRAEVEADALDDLLGALQRGEPSP